MSYADRDQDLESLSFDLEAVVLFGHQLVYKVLAPSDFYESLRLCESVDQFFTTVVEFLKFGGVERDRCRELFLGLSGLWRLSWKFRLMALDSFGARKAACMAWLEGEGIVRVCR